MKKILSILGTISLSTIISTNIIACNPTKENNKPNQTIIPQFISQQPPTNSNWKLVDNYQSEFSKKNNNWYSVLFNFEGYKIINFYNSSNEIRVDFNNLTLMKDNDNNLYLYKKWGSPLPIPNINFTVYRWDGINEPIIPTINKNTGEIKNWN
ncbi:MAG: hypothetical protein EIB84_00205 (plasmid) [Spiroplasma poulsonii]|uniref:DUF3688 domain-containing protein n=2 Tax=Spiroplasma poulsonii TaxID=2138 RepID=A0A2P6F8B5_9MOLU|nr:lipoprotein [Spiroplasma poulsonii]MBW1241344.1 hypothetical protein [Spiroplasma poulsonii]PQM29681.1 hypothetical protein SMSRO_SF030820 [Spiroplasma poulsonii]PQM29693.1 hypothetical protein SMSRO_SF030940 [Spiroplasma poulsonii]PQM29707.1 hypothetical protein SMSRO_SF031080 [Spiroplasma poulsonii]